MSDGPWSYRIELADGPSRAGSLEREGRRLRLPVLLDIETVLERDRLVQRLSVVHPDWEGAEVALERDANASGPWEGVIRAQLQRKGLDRLTSAVDFHRRVLRIDGTPSPVNVVGPIGPIHRDVKALNETLAAARGNWPASPPLFLPGMTDGDNIEALLYLGVEVQDASGARTDAAEGNYYTMDGREPLRLLRQRADPAGLCGCPECAAGLPDASSLSRHNVMVLRRRLALAESMLKDGRLRSHVMGRLSGKPALAALVRRVENGPGMPDLGHTYRKEMVRPVTYRDDIRDPDFQCWARRISDEYVPHPGKKVLLLLPCSARKPYSSSRTHQRVRGALAPLKGWRGVCQQVVITSPLGAVPMELDSLYPASYYDIPVTGEWYPEEMSLMRDLVGSIAGKGNYTDVVCYHPEGGEIFEEAARAGRMGELPFHLARDEGALREALSPIVDRERASAPDPASADACSLLRFSLGAEIPWETRLAVKSSFDRSDIRLGRTHLAELKKGGPVPSMEGGEALWRNGWCRKVVIDDFVPKGTVFAQGVLRTEGRIRTGDIVLVGTASEFRGVGRAVLPGHAMTSEARGNAVRMLDHVRG